MSTSLPPPTLSQSLTIGMQLYPGFTLLDLAGPQAERGMSARAGSNDGGARLRSGSWRRGNRRKVR